MKEVEEKLFKKSEFLEDREKYIAEIDDKYKKIENEIEAKEIIKSYDSQEENEFMYKETVSNFLKNPDGEKSLTMFIYVMHKKIKTYQHELEQSNYFYNLVKIKKKETANTFLKQVIKI